LTLLLHQLPPAPAATPPPAIAAQVAFAVHASLCYRLVVSVHSLCVSCRLSLSR
jgi:hypothetical protein